MKYIINESQSNRVWLLRRYDLVEEAFNETVRYTNPCKFNSFGLYERRFLMNMMGELHPIFYDIEGFDYDGVYIELNDIFQ